MGQTIVNMNDRSEEEKELFMDFAQRSRLAGVDASIDRDGRDYWIFINCHKNVMIDGQIDTTLKFPIRVPSLSLAKTEDVCDVAFDHIRRLAPMIDRGFIDPHAGMMGV